MNRKLLALFVLLVFSLGWINASFGMGPRVRIDSEEVRVAKILAAFEKPIKFGEEREALPSDRWLRRDAVLTYTGMNGDSKACFVIVRQGKIAYSYNVCIQKGESLYLDVKYSLRLDDLSSGMAKFSVEFQ